MERVAELVGLLPEHLAAKQLRVDAVVRPSASGGWQTHLRIETVAGSGERSFSADDCRSLVRGTALIIALTVDPEAASAHQEVAAPSIPALASPAISNSPRPTLLLRPMLAGEWGALPRGAFAYGGAVGVTWPRLRLEVDGLTQSSQAISNDRGHSATVRAPLSSGARTCLAPWTASLEPAACLGAGLTWLRSTGGDDIAFPETHNSLAVALSGGVALGWRLRDWLWLRVEAHAGVMVRRPKLQVQTASQVDDVYAVPWLTARVAGGLEFRL
jgi:hypothetical protein